MVFVKFDDHYVRQRPSERLQAGTPAVQSLKEKSIERSLNDLGQFVAVELGAAAFERPGSFAMRFELDVSAPFYRSPLGSNLLST